MRREKSFTKGELWTSYDQLHGSMEVSQNASSTRIEGNEGGKVLHPPSGLEGLLKLLFSSRYLPEERRIFYSYAREKDVSSIFGDMVSFWYIWCCFGSTPCADPPFLYIFYDSLDLCKPSENKSSTISYMHHRQSRARNTPE